MNSNNREEVMKNNATEWPGTGVLLSNELSGKYVCGQCGIELFLSNDKYDSQSGWPAFSNVAKSDNVILTKDTSQNMNRTSVSCKKCGGHLGHVFDVDKQQSETGKWYCINSVSLDFESDDGKTIIKGDEN